MKLRNERKQTFRAWIGIGEPHIHFQGYFNKNRQFIPREKWSKMSPDERNAFGVSHTRRYMEIKNYGQLPALKLKIRSKFIIGKKPTKDIIESEPFDSSATIMPNGTLKMFFELSEDEERATEDPDKVCYFIWETEYESPKGTKRKYGEISIISTQNYTTLETWDEN